MTRPSPRRATAEEKRLCEKAYAAFWNEPEELHHGRFNLWATDLKRRMLLQIRAQRKAGKRRGK